MKQITPFPLIVIFFITQLSMVNAQVNISPPDLITNVTVTTDWTTVTTTEDSYNEARRQEEIQLGLCPNAIRDLDLPDQATWDAYSSDQKALIILNDERTSRAGVDYGNGNGPVAGHPFNGIESNIDGVAQNWAQYLADNNLFGHCLPVNGVESCPGQRIDAGYPAGCTEFGGGIENLFASSGNIPDNQVILSSIFNWNYTDATSSWGHRSANLSQGYDDDYGASLQEGFVGFGIAHPPVGAGTVVVVNFTNPVADADAGACNYNLSVPTNSVPGCLSAVTVTAPNGGEILTAGGTFDITWNASTCFLTTDVKISLSLDGGTTYPIILAANTLAADGTETVTIPGGIPTNTTTARIKIESTAPACASSSIFDYSDGNFTINSNCLLNASIVCPATPVEAPAGDPSLNFSMTPDYYANAVTLIPINIQAGAPEGQLSARQSNGVIVCGEFFGIKKYQIFDFKVTKAGNYTFNYTGSVQYSLFSGTGYNPTTGQACNNWLQSNTWGTPAGLGWGGGFSIDLEPCVNYQIVAWDAFNNNPLVSTIEVSGPGTVFSLSGAPGADYAYTYAAVNTTTNLIAAVSSTSDFTTLVEGSYLIYGAAYFNGGGTNPPPATPSTWVEQTLAQVINGGNCLRFSENTKSVIVQAPLPVELLSFTARSSDDKSVHLQWVTASELDNDYFELESSINGIDFKVIDTQRGMGTTSIKQYYESWDESPVIGNNYYRLKQVDFDGRFEYSDIEVVMLDSDAVSFVLFPNPASNQITIRFDANQEDGMVRLFNAIGQEVMNQRLASGEMEQRISVAHLSKGVYYLDLVVNGKHANQKLLLY